ncbi:SH3 domain-binding protein 5 -like protein [Halotydeus destructor]|nr:SH3 domain-binding protein 5 -like protein [Halotydeus destructor]
MNSINGRFRKSSLSNSLISEDTSDDGHTSESKTSTECDEQDIRVSASKSSDEEEENLRIEDILEELNQSTSRINKLEIELEFLTEYSDRLKNLAKDIGAKLVTEARPYYELEDRAKECRKECQQTVLAYDQACQDLLRAKEEVDSVERTLRNQSTGDFDESWQEMFNQATIKVLDAERCKADCKERHEQCMKELLDGEETIALFEDRFKYAIMKSRPYFEESRVFKSHLAKIRTEISTVNDKIVKSKSCYSVKLEDLETDLEDADQKEMPEVVCSSPRQPEVSAHISSFTQNGLRTLNQVDYSDVWASHYSIMETINAEKPTRPSRRQMLAEKYKAASSACDNGDNQQLIDGVQQLKLHEDDFDEFNLDQLVT